MQVIAGSTTLEFLVRPLDENDEILTGTITDGNIGVWSSGGVLSFTAASEFATGSGYEVTITFDDPLVAGNLMGVSVPIVIDAVTRIDYHDFSVVESVDLSGITNTVNAIKLVTDSLDTGGGLYPLHIYVRDGSTPIDGVACWLTRDTGGDEVLHGPKYTNTQGLAIFSPDTGDYYLWRNLAGYSFTNPQAITYTGGSWQTN